MSEQPSRLGQLLPEVERVVEEIPLEDGPALIGELERLKARLWLRMIEATRAPAVAPPEPPTAERLLSVDEAAGMLGVTTRWLYDHAHDIPARVELPGRVTRFSRRKLEKWIAQRLP